MRFRVVSRFNEVLLQLPRRAMSTHVALKAVLLFASVVLMQSDAAAKCDEFYRVVRGDTLREIAVRQIGTRDYRMLFSANSEILSKPSQIETGQLLYLPCASGPQIKRSEALSSAGIRPTPRDDLGNNGAKRIAASALRTEPVETSALRTEVDSNTIRLLTGTQRAPLVGRDLPAGGLVPALLVEALSRTGETPEIELAIVEDWKAHLTRLMPSGDFQLAAPWPRPDCDARDRGPLTKRLCETYRFSEPVYEVRVSTLVAPQSALANVRSVEALKGQRVCRPADFPGVDLETHPELIISEAPDAETCADMLAKGDIDAISLLDAEAKQLLAARNLIEAPYLVTSVPVHVVAPRSAPGSEALIRRLDNGLARLRDSGRWYELVTDYLRPPGQARETR